MLAKALARSVDCSFSRLQFTPDLLPSDVTGVNVFNQRTNEFEFRPGPVFANLLLVDEINRASPKTQAALLESMQENQVTVDGVSYELAAPFMVIATQNPIEYEGTYPLPEAQLDRFTLRTEIGYPPLPDEARMLTEQTSDPPLESLRPVATAADVRSLTAAASEIFVEESVNRYVVTLLRQTRADARVYLGASPRAGIALLRVAKARALADGRGFVSPDDVKAAAEPVLAHRLIVAPEARAAGLSGGPARPRDARAHTGSRMTKRGRLALALGATTYLAAWAFGSKVLYPVAIGLPVAVLLAWLWTALANRPLQVRRKLPSGERLEGDDVEVEVRLVSERRLVPARWTLRERIGKLGEVATPLGADGHARYVLERLRRGRYAFEGSVAVIEDPFGLERVEQPLDSPGALLVYPRLVELVRLFSEGGTRSHDGRRLLLRRPSGFDLHSVREYEHGDSLRKVHWRTTARRAQLMVKELEDAPRDEVAVVLDADPEAVVGGELRRAGPGGGVAPALARPPGAARRARRQRRPRRAAGRSVGRRRLAAGARPARRRRAGARPAARRACSPTRRARRAGARARGRDGLTAPAPRRAARRARARQRQRLARLRRHVQLRRRAPKPMPELLRLQAAGVAVVVLREGDDLAERLGAAEPEAAHG